MQAFAKRLHRVRWSEQFNEFFALYRPKIALFVWEASRIIFSPALAQPLQSANGSPRKPTAEPIFLRRRRASAVHGQAAFGHAIAFRGIRGLLL